MTITINGTTGITTPEITLDNTAADGGQVVLKSSGYSNWNLDNYSGRLRGYYGSTEYWTVDASGNMGIGTSSPSASYRLSLTGGAGLNIQNTGASDNSIVKYSNSGKNWYVGLRGDTSNMWAVADDSAFRMAIDSSGNLLVGTTSAVGKITSVQSANGTFAMYSTLLATSGVVYGVGVGLNYVPNNNSSLFYYGSDTSAARFSVYSNGGIANYQANNANLSDAREKKEVALAGNYLEKICAIPVKTFLYNDQTDTDKNLGVIAQDVQAVAPELVSESDWGTPEEPKIRLSIYQTDLQYALMKCIQEQQALINNLTERLSALENK